MAGAALSPLNVQLLSINPVTDLGLAYSTDAYGLLWVDIPLDNNGDWATVAGTDRLLQEFTRAFFVTVGSDSLNPDYGSDVLLDLGSPLPSSLELYNSRFASFVASFTTQQATEAVQGYYSPDELLDHVENLYISLNPSRSTVTFSAVLVAQSGAASVPFSQTRG